MESRSEEGIVWSLGEGKVFYGEEERGRYCRENWRGEGIGGEGKVLYGVYERGRYCKETMRGECIVWNLGGGKVL